MLVSLISAAVGDSAIIKGAGWRPGLGVQEGGRSSASARIHNQGPIRRWASRPISATGGTSGDFHDQLQSPQARRENSRPTRSAPLLVSTSGLSVGAGVSLDLQRFLAAMRSTSIAALSPRAARDCK